MRKLRTNAGDKVTSDASQVFLATIHNAKYCIQLNDPILTDHAALYPYSLNNPLLFELILSPVSNIVVYSDVTKAPKYSLTNLELEYQCITI